MCVYHFVAAVLSSLCMCGVCICKSVSVSAYVCVPVSAYD